MGTRDDRTGNSQEQVEPYTSKHVLFHATEAIPNDSASFNATILKAAAKSARKKEWAQA